MNERKKHHWYKSSSVETRGCGICRQENFDVLQPAGTSNQEEFLRVLEWLHGELLEARLTFTNDGEVEYQGVKYQLKSTVNVLKGKCRY